MSILENVEGKQPRPRRSFTAEFKAEIVECCQRGDGSIGQVARDFDLTETAVREWVPQAERDAGTRSDGLTSAERDEFAQLRRENRGCGRTSKFFGGHRQTTMKDHNARYRRRQKGLANWRLVRCADDWVAMIAGTRADAEQLRRDIADVLAPIGLRLSAEKPKVVHLEEGFDFLGYHIQWRRKRGISQRHIYPYRVCCTSG